MVLRGGRGMLNTEHRHVNQHDAVRALVDPTVRRFLEPFLGRECTIKMAAEDLKVSPNSVLYRVNRLLELGLVRVTRIEPRRGRAIKHYQSVADAFLATFEHFDDASAMELYGLHEGANLEAFSSALFRIGYKIGLIGPEIIFTLSRTDMGDVKAEINMARNGAVLDLTQPEMPAATGSWSFLRLDLQDAKNLQRELVEIKRRYEAKHGAQRYVLRLGLAPKEG
jgi:DNA-binding transcriptional ArsR family regulator